MLSAQHKKNIRDTFNTVAEDPAALGHAFYTQLFENAPSVRPLFSEDMAAQNGKLAQMIATVVANLDSLESIVPAIQALGVRHVGYGAEEDHYGAVGAALIETLSQNVPDWGDDDAAAWGALYGIAANIMIDAAQDAQQAAQTG